MSEQRFMSYILMALVKSLQIQADLNVAVTCSTAILNGPMIIEDHFLMGFISNQHSNTGIGKHLKYMTLIALPSMMMCAGSAQF